MQSSLQIDPEHATWVRFKYELSNLTDIKYPDAKYTINQVKKWIENYPKFRLRGLKQALNNIVSKSDQTNNIIQWTKDLAEEHARILSYNDYSYVWRTYENSLYLAFRKLIGERTLKKEEKTINLVKIDKHTNSVILHITSKFTQQNKDIALKFFVEEKGASNIVFIIV